MILLKKLMPLTRKGEVLILKETVAKEKGHHGQGTTLRIIQGIEEALILKETCFLILFLFMYITNAFKNKCNSKRALTLLLFRFYTSSWYQFINCKCTNLLPILAKCIEFITNQLMLFILKSLFSKLTEIKIDSNYN